MEWLIGSSEETKSNCLATLKFWINSIVVHTYDTNTNETAPIALIGTRKDRVGSPAHHQEISTILYNNFCSSLAWPSVIENDSALGTNGRARMFFFPVDNVRGRADPTVSQLMGCIESVIDESSYVHQEQPLSYLHTLDKLASLNRSYLSYGHAYDVAVKCGVEPRDVSNMLKLFHEMGTLMFHGSFVSDLTCLHVGQLCLRLSHGCMCVL